MTHNEIKYLKSLSFKKYRNQHKKFFVEGKRIVDELIQSKHKIDKIIITQDFIDKHSEHTLFSSKLDYQIISDKDYKKIKNTSNSQGIFALIPMKDSFNTKNNIKGPTLILNNISDPGNMGTLLRSAVWYGVNNIFISRGSVDIYNPKVVRSSMGAHFYLSNLFELDVYDIISILINKNFQIIAATLGGISYKNISIKNHNWVLILGSEAHGIDSKILKLANQQVSIPQKGNIESLNVAVSGSILLDRFLTK